MFVPIWWVARTARWHTFKTLGCQWKEVGAYFWNLSLSGCSIIKVSMFQASIFIFIDMQRGSCENESSMCCRPWMRCDSIYLFTKSLLKFLGMVIPHTHPKQRDYHLGGRYTPNECWGECLTLNQKAKYLPQVEVVRFDSVTVFPTSDGRCLAYQDSYFPMRVHGAER